MIHGLTTEERRELIKTKSNKWWKLNRGGGLGGGLQWESRKHPDFLFISVFGNSVFRRVGNRLFVLTGCAPFLLYEGKKPRDAKTFARQWVKTHSDEYA